MNVFLAFSFRKWYSFKITLIHFFVLLITSSNTRRWQHNQHDLEPEFQKEHVTLIQKYVFPRKSLGSIFLINRYILVQITFLINVTFFYW